MKKRPTTFIALLRGINVGGHNLIPMADLRSLCAEFGDCVQSYIQSGNLLFNATSTAAVLETKLEHSIKRRFGLSIPVIVRSTTQWAAYVAENPFPEAAKKEPHFVMLTISKTQPKSDAATRLQERATNGERVIRVSDALWVHYANGAGRSKLPALFDRFAGSSVTARNWSTALKLDELAKQAVEKIAR